MTRRNATLVGASAVLMWATLAALTAAAGPVPPLQMTAMAFAIAATVMGLRLAATGRPVRAILAQPWPVWALGVGGLGGYHALYFTALANAPAVEASLIAYLWPLLIVVFSGLLPGERIRWYHLAGVAAGFAGSAILVTGGEAGALRFKSEFLAGYLVALAASLVWSGYSVLSRRFAGVPSDIVGGFCAAVAVLALFAHLALETTIWPEGWRWLCVLGLGLGPVGLAFVTWDVGVKKGDIRALGAMAYGAPLLSTLLLIALGMAPASAGIVIACGLIVGGAVIASGDLLRRS